MSKDRVLVALSGGVDSSVAALLLQQQGFDVVGVFLRHGVALEAPGKRLKQGCCSVEDARDAAQVADRLGIPFHAIDMEEEFSRIVEDFVAEYLRGHTPNPCVKCNQQVKFGAMWNLADAIGARYLATGHYAQVVQGADGAQLHRGLDPRKDQSYVLFPIGPDRLSRVLLPVGGLHKTRVREIAEEARLPVFSKPDSVEICFVPSGDYRDLLRERGSLGRPGRILDTEGKVLAEHDGHAGFTRGQRRGLGIAAAHPLYVLDIDPVRGDVLVGRREQTGCRSVRVRGFRTFGLELEPQGWRDVLVQYRSSPGGVPAEVRPTEGGLEVQFAHPAESVNPGQGLAVYRGDRLLGGGWIDAIDLTVGFQV